MIGDLQPVFLGKCCIMLYNEVVNHAGCGAGWCVVEESGVGCESRIYNQYSVKTGGKPVDIPKNRRFDRIISDTR